MGGLSADGPLKSTKKIIRKSKVKNDKKLKGFCAESPNLENLGLLGTTGTPHAHGNVNELNLGAQDTRTNPGQKTHQNLEIYGKTPIPSGTQQLEREDSFKIAQKQLFGQKNANMAKFTNSGFGDQNGGFEMLGKRQSAELDNQTAFSGLNTTDYSLEDSLIKKLKLEDYRSFLNSFEQSKGRFGFAEQKNSLMEEFEKISNFNLSKTQKSNFEDFRHVR